MRKVLVTRRQVLRGAGGFSLGLPLLPSLLPGKAYAVSYALARQPRFVSLHTQHGGISPENMYPTPTLTTSPFLTGHDVRHGRLAASRSGTRASLSPVLTANSSVLTDRLVSKMNVMRGFDIPYYIGHHTGGFLGNFVRSDQGPKNLSSWATIDQVMAWSSSFYPTLDGVKMRSIVTGQDFHGDSFVWSNTTTKSGAIQKVAVESSSQALFDKLFVPGGANTPPPVAARKPIVDLVVANYRSLAQSNRRMSTEDKRRLDDHLSRLSELQRSVSSAPQPIVRNCGSYTKAAQDSRSFDKDNVADATRFYKLINDVIAMGFACGTSRIATIHLHLPFSDYSGSWHQDVAHQHANPQRQAILVAGLQATFEGAIVDLASKLDSIEEAPGVTVLDNTLYQWMQESGWATHDAQDMPIVTFGSAADKLNTGLFVDYRSQNPRAHLDIFGLQKQFCGIWQRHWLAAVLQYMGVPRAEFEKNGKTGYGDPFYDPSYARAVHPDIINKASDLLPVITKA